MKYYLSGAITGRDEKDYTAHFDTIEKYVKDTFDNAEVFNPVQYCKKLKSTREDGILTWGDYMSSCIEKLLEADTLVLLNGWEASKGANLEYRLAKRMNMYIITENLYQDNK